MKSKEELLSEETRAAAESASRFLQWGVTLMISIQTALFFVRREAANALIEAGKLPKGSEVPLERYFLGTGFLIFIALVLSMLTKRSTAQYRNYKRQLAACRDSGITDLPVRYTGRWAYGLYAAFPAIDLLARVLISFSIKFQ
jgi:hypothetical protein